MENEELNNLVDILQRKIYSANINFIEYHASRNSFLLGLALTKEDYSKDKIKTAILNNDDLNRFGEIFGEKCMFTDKLVF